MRVRNQRSGIGKAIFCGALCALLVALCPRAHAQQPKKPRIGWLTAGSLSSSFSVVRQQAFRQGLRERGYLEGKDLFIEWRGADNKQERGTALAEELVRLMVNVIVTTGTGSTRPAKEATTTIPIVMAQDRDPVANGFVASLAHPGGNITGLSRIAPELSGKRVELLKETVPKLSLLAVLGGSTQSVTAQTQKEVELAAKGLGVKLQNLNVAGAKDIETGFEAAAKAHADAILWLVGGQIATSLLRQIAGLAIKSRLPVIYEQAAFVEAGGLMSYGPNFLDLDRRAATYVDRILKGAKPADLPVEQPTKFELVINLKAAQQIGLTIPPNVLARADRVIR